jgi:hypothetical protein
MMPRHAEVNIGLKVYKTTDFIRKTASGEMDLARSIKAVRKLADAADYHRDCNILIDVRETQSTISHIEQMKLAMEFGNYRHLFHNKIAILIPPASDRIEKANLMKRCMEADGFAIKVFLDFEHAIEWFSEVTSFDNDN